MTATAPRATASSMKPWPSARRPAMATNRLPGTTARESASIEVISTADPVVANAGSMPAALRSATRGRAARVGCTVAVYGRVASIMPGKKQKRQSSLSLADALTATRAAHSRVLALAARLEETERTILAAMATTPSSASSSAAASSPAKRPVGRPPKAASAAPGKRSVGRPRTSAAAAPAKRPVGRPRKSVAAQAPAKRPVGRPPKAASSTAPAKRPVGRPRTRPARG